jgi:hypothetical protein
MKPLLLKYLTYIFRWQLSTPILALFTGGWSVDSFKNSIVANFIGSLLFFWVDRWIFNIGKEKNEN